VQHHGPVVREAAAGVRAAAVLVVEAELGLRGLEATVVPAEVVHSTAEDLAGTEVGGALAVAVEHLALAPEERARP